MSMDIENLKSSLAQSTWTKFHKYNSLVHLNSLPTKDFQQIVGLRCYDERILNSHLITCSVIIGRQGCTPQQIPLTTCTVIGLGQARRRISASHHL